MPTPFNYSADSASLQRRRKVLEAMAGESLRPMEMPTQPGATVSPFAALLPALKFMAGQAAEKNHQADEAKFAENSRNAVAEAMAKFQTTSQGGEGVPGDPRKAIMEAMASDHPDIKSFGQKQWENLEKGRLQPKDLAAYANPADVLKSPENPGGWAPKSELGEVGGIVYDKNSRNVVTLGGPKPTTETINGDLYETSPSTGAKKKLDNAPKVSVGVSPTIINAGQKKGMETYWDNAAKKVDELGKVATSASNNKQTLAELRNLDSQGIFSNATTGPATFLNNLGQAVGVQVDTTKLGNTEAYNALTTDLWQGLVSKFGGNRGVTKEEAAEIKKMLPLAANSPQARQQLFTILDRAADRQIQQYQYADSAFAEAVQLDDPRHFSQKIQGIYVPEPSAPAPVTQPAGKKKPTTSNW